MTNSIKNSITISLFYVNIRRYIFTIVIQSYIQYNKHLCFSYNNFVFKYVLCQWNVLLYLLLIIKSYFTNLWLYFWDFFKHPYFIFRILFLIHHAVIFTNTHTYISFFYKNKKHELVVKPFYYNTFQWTWKKWSWKQNIKNVIWMKIVLCSVILT